MNFSKRIKEDIEIEVFDCGIKEVNGVYTKIGSRYDKDRSACIVRGCIRSTCRWIMFNRQNNSSLFWTSSHSTDDPWLAKWVVRPAGPALRATAIPKFRVTRHQGEKTTQARLTLFLEDVPHF